VRKLAEPLVGAGASIGERAGRGAVAAACWTGWFGGEDESIQRAGMVNLVCSDFIALPACSAGAVGWLVLASLSHVQYFSLTHLMNQRRISKQFRTLEPLAPANSATRRPSVTVGPWPFLMGVLK